MKKKEKSFFEKNFTLIVILVIVGMIIAIYLGIGSITENKQEQAKNLPYGDDVIEMTYFHLITCPHCIKQNEFNMKIIKQYPNLRITKYEITQSGTQAKYKEVAATFDGLDPEKFPGTPLTIIGNRKTVGFGSDETTGKEILSMIKEEQARIDSSWNDETMIRTIDLRNQLEE